MEIDTRGRDTGRDTDKKKQRDTGIKIDGRTEKIWRNRETENMFKERIRQRDTKDRER